MTDALNGKTFLVGAAISGYEWKFTRPINDTTTVYTNSDIKVKIFSLDKKGKPTSTTPSVVLGIDSGLTRTVNTANNQSGKYQITANQVASLLGTAESKKFSYAWYIQPPGYEPVRAPVGDGYDGWFIIAKEGYAGSDSIEVS